MARHFSILPLMAGALVIVVALGAGCASRRSVSDLGERILFLEREVLSARTDVAAEREELHDLDLRVQYLEREAVRRGVPVPLGPVRPAAEGQPSSPAREVAENRTGSSPASSPSGPAEERPAASAQTPPAGKPSPAPAGAPGTPNASPASDTNGKASAGQEPAESRPGTPSAPPAAPATQETRLPDVRESTPATPAPPAAPATATARPEQRAYDAALQLYRTGRFAESQAAFQAFLEVYPNSRLAANALYWMGETHYSRGQYTDAIFAFKDVQTRFPHHPKTPDSLLKTAMAYEKLGDKSNASLHLAALYEDWPEAEATRRAKEKGLRP